MWWASSNQLKARVEQKERPLPSKREFSCTLPLDFSATVALPGSVEDGLWPHTGTLAVCALSLLVYSADFRLARLHNCSL